MLGIAVTVTAAATGSSFLKEQFTLTIVCGIAGICFHFIEYDKYCQRLNEIV